MVIIELNSGHKISLLGKLGNGDVRVGFEGHFERGEGILKREDQQRLFDELAGYLDVSTAVETPPGTGDAVSVSDEE